MLFFLILFFSTLSLSIIIPTSRTTLQSKVITSQRRTPLTPLKASHSNDVQSKQTTKTDYFVDYQKHKYSYKKFYHKMADRVSIDSEDDVLFPSEECADEYEFKTFVYQDSKRYSFIKQQVPAQVICKFFPQEKQSLIDGNCELYFEKHGVWLRGGNMAFTLLKQSYGFYYPPNKPMVFIQLLVNQSLKSPMPLKGVGSALVRAARRISESCGGEGRVGLKSLGSAFEFYKKLGFEFVYGRDYDLYLPLDH